MYKKTKGKEIKLTRELTAEFPRVVNKPRQKTPSRGPPMIPNIFNATVRILSKSETRNATPSPSIP